MIFKTVTENEFYTGERCFITEILNTENIKNISIARARVEPGITTQLHTLDIDEVYYILQGTGEMKVGNSPKKNVKEGDAIFIKSNIAQQITNTSDSDLIFLCICNPKFSPEVYTNLE